MQNGEEASPSISPAVCGQLMKMFITLEPHGTFGYGTVRSKTSSYRDDSLQNHFSNGTVHPGTVRSICNNEIKDFLRNENRF